MKKVIVMLLLLAVLAGAVYGAVTFVSPSYHRPIYIRPTGFSSVPPPGPAIPVTDTQMSLPETRAMPSAISLAVCSLTAPYFSRVSADTPSSSILALLL